MKSGCISQSEDKDVPYNILKVIVLLGIVILAAEVIISAVYGWNCNQDTDKFLFTATFSKNSISDISFLTVKHIS